MSVKNILFLFLIFLSLSSCVSKKMYEDLDFKYNRLLNSNSDLIKSNETLVADRNALLSDKKQLQTDIEALENRKQNVENEYNSAQARLDQLIASYNALESESNLELNAKAVEIQKLLQDLSAKERALAAESSRLRELQNTLEERAQTIENLQSMIAENEAKMNQLKNAVSAALQTFEGKGLTVTQKNGKVYVSMENKLLFDSGSWAVGSQGAKAVSQLAQVLVQNPDIEVLIEGHTDNVPYSGSVLIDNWDLSVKRATAIVRILQSKGVKPKQLSASGRGEYLPFQDNSTSEGRAKNRRIEIILAPNLDTFNKLLEE